MSKRRDDMFATFAVWWCGVVTIAAAMYLVSGCSHTVPKGIDLAQQGLAGVDMATRKLADLYEEATRLCRTRPLPGCDKLGEPAMVADKLDVLGGAYDQTAVGLEEAERAWAEVAPHFQAAEEVVKNAVD